MTATVLEKNTTVLYSEGQAYLLVPLPNESVVDLENWAEEHDTPLPELAAQTLLDEAHR